MVTAGKLLIHPLAAFERIIRAVLFLAVLTIATRVVAAYPVTYAITGALAGTPISGTDPLMIAGANFSLTGVIDSTAAPVSTGPGTATYVMPTVSVVVSQFAVNLSNIPVTISVYNGNISTLSISTPIVSIPFSAVIGTPEGTITSTVPSAFGSVPIAPGTSPVYGSVVTYGAGTNETVLAIIGTVAAVTTAPLLDANPTPLVFAYQVTGTTPPPQPLIITAPTPIDVSVSPDGASWLLVDTSTGTTPVTLNVSVEPGELSPGTYNSSIMITSAQAVNSPLMVSVTLTVSPPPLPGPSNPSPAFPALTREDFTEVAPQGFGDRQNGWAWSMEWFKGKLYVGTNRAWHCVEVATLKRILHNWPYPPIDPDIQCTPDSNDLPLQAEIWAWAPDTNEWTRVYQSPADIAIPEAPGKFVARDIGFRGMHVFREPDGTEALYVSGVSSKPMHPGVPGARILRSVDGINFQPIPQSPGTFLGELKNAVFRGMTTYNGKLYIIAGTIRGSGVILESADPAKGDDSFRQITPPGQQVFEIATFNGLLYATFSHVDGFSAVKTDCTGDVPYNFHPVIVKGGYSNHFPNQDGLSLKVFNGSLYVGGNGIHRLTGAELFRINADDTWDLIVGESRDTPDGRKNSLSGLGRGFSWFMNAHIWRMEVFDNRLYVGTFDGSTVLRNLPRTAKFLGPQLGFDLWWTEDGTHFSQVDHQGFGDKFNFGARNLKATDYGLFLGTTNYYYGLQIWRGVPKRQGLPLAVNPTSLNFSLPAGSPPASQLLRVTSDVLALSFTATAAVTSPAGANWLNVAPASTNTRVAPDSTNISATADPSGLIPGTYLGTLMFTDTAGHTQQVGVTLTVTPAIAPPASLVITPGPLTFSYQTGGTPPGNQQIQISSNSAPLSFTASSTVSTPAGGHWLHVSPTSATAPGSPASVPLTVTADPTGLVPGSYTGAITVNDASQGTHQVSVTLTVAAAPSASLKISPASLTFTYQAGASALPPAQTVLIGSTGQPLAFTAAVSTTPGTGTWLNLSASGGTASGSPGATGLTVTVTPTGMAPGTYSGTITVIGGSGNPQQVSVTLGITAATSNNKIVSSVNSLSFLYTIGGVLPARQPITVASTGVSLPFTLSSNNGWIQTQQQNIATPPSAGTTLAYVGVTVKGLAAGSYTGQVTINSTSASNTPQTITVNLTVAPPGSATATSPRIIAHLANGQGWKTTILLVNTDTKPQPFTLSLWDEQGNPASIPLGVDGSVSSITGTIAPGQLRMIQTDGSGAALMVGWGQLTAVDAVGGTVVFTARSNGQPPSEAAVPLSTSGSTQLLLPFDQTHKQFSFTTGLALANPSSNAATVSVNFIDEFGERIGVTGNLSVPAHGHYAAVLGTLYPQIQGRRGVMQLSSDTELYGLGIRYNGAAFTSIEALAKSRVSTAPKVISHLANGQGWKTSILLINADTQPAPFTINFWKADGRPLTLPLGADGAVPAVSGTIAPGNIRIIESDGSGDALVEGWAILNTAHAIGGTAIFTAQSSGVPPSEAAVPLISSGSTQLFMPFENTYGALGYATGLALANPSFQDATVSVSFIDDSGQSMTASHTITIPGHGHYAGVLGDVFPEIQGKRGAAQFQSDNGPLYGLGIRFNGGAYTSIGTIAPNTK
ncbi:MAG: hypothetical protein JWO48_318 [Bryobacterales bacterium]|nr:hypothetical protein [Bryobacterales bacterium]